MEGEHPKNIGTIFRGTGKRIFETEKLLYHQSIKVYWQNKVWDENKFNVDWKENHLGDISYEHKLEQKNRGRDN